jgi:hypothetical protein
MKRWPALLWLPVYVASELILIGSDRRWGMMVAGGLLALLAFGLSAYLALRDWGGPRPAWFAWAVGGLAAFYVLVAGFASLAGTDYTLAALMAGVIPLTALSLVLAIARTKTEASGGRLRDVSASDHEDPFPGVGLDDEGAFGAAPEPDGRRRRAGRS